MKRRLSLAQRKELDTLPWRWSIRARPSRSLIPAIPSITPERCSPVESPGAKSVCLEFYSCSKSFNMTGWRLAFAVGNKEMVGALRRFKNNVDSGAFNAVQYAAIAAFENAEKYIAANNKVYQRRRDLL